MNKEILKDLVILYAEDEDDIRDFTYKTLSSILKKVYVVKDGLDGLKKFKDNKDINLILTDINIPKLDGLQMCEEIRKFDSEIPIIVTSAHSDYYFLKKSIDLKVSSYSMKPIDLYQLVESMIKAIEPIFLKKQLELVSMKLNNKIQEEKKEIQNILNTQKNLLLLIEDNKIIDANKKFLEYFKIENIEQLLSDKNTIYKLFNSKNNLFEPIEYLEENSCISELKKLDDLNRIIKVKSKLKEKIPFLMNIDKIEGEKDRYILSLTDISKLNEKTNLLDFQTNHDLITGLYNKNKFSGILSKEIKRDKRYNNELSIIAFNINTKEKIEDDILKEISNIILDDIREADTVGRWDEFDFLLILPQTQIDGAMNVANKIKETIQNNKLISNTNDLSINLGITSLKEKDNETSLLEKVTSALEKAKEEGNNTISCI